MKNTLYILAVVGAAAVFAAGSAAGTVSNPRLGFSALFPCQAQTTSRTIAASFGKIPVTTFSCADAGDIFIVSVSQYAKGFVAGHPAIYRDAANSAAANVKGSVRSDTPVRLGAVTGHDVLIDVPAQKAAAHLRLFFVGDRQYQVMFLGPKGHENSPPAQAFLNAFRLK